MADTSGTPRRVTLDGVTYNVVFDANFSETPEVTTEGIRHTGGTQFKQTLNTAQVESVTLVVPGGANARLIDLSKRTVSFPMSYELANGDVYRANGQINLEPRETEENRRDVILIPDGGEWKAFLSS